MEHALRPVSEGFAILRSMMIRRERLWGVACLVLFVADRLLKQLALSGARLGGENAPARFDLFRNGGIAFSLPFSGPLVWLASVAILGVICLMAARDVRARRFDRAGAYGLFIFGACSNLFDRVVYGYTIDYLILVQRSAVNLADGMIVAGAFWLIMKTPKK